jgi:hypothetical protein
MANGTTTYSFKDLVGSITSPLAGSFVLAGAAIGNGQVRITMTTTRSELDTAADGAVMVSYIAGSAGMMEIECQQTSALHKFLLYMNNLHQTAADADDVSSWAASSVQLRNITDGSQHLATGVSLAKTPDKTYAVRGGMITWSLPCAHVTNL